MVGGVPTFITVCVQVLHLHVGGTGLMMKMTKFGVILALAVGLAGCVGAESEEVGSTAAALSAQFVVSCSGSLPAGFAADVASNGDTLVFSSEDAGFALIGTADPDAYETRSCDVTADVSAQWVSPHENVEASRSVKSFW